MGPVATTSEPLPAGARVLAVHDSPPLSEIVKVVNKESQNLHAEMLLRLLGAARRGARAASRRATTPSASSCAAIGVATQTWGLQDGSGLSRSDLVTPHGLAALLAAMDRHPRRRGLPRQSARGQGVDGTLEDRMRGTRRAGAGLGQDGDPPAR